jgi:hypothetical protein
LINSGIVGSVVSVGTGSSGVANSVGVTCSGGRGEIVPVSSCSDGVAFEVEEEVG